MKVSAGTVARTAVLALALVNQVLVATGHNVLPISDDQMANVVSTGFTVVMAIVGWWKNHSFTNAAQIADSVFDAIKSGKVSASDVKQLVSQSK